MKSTNTPQYKKFVFIQNEKRADIFDLQGETDPRIFHYFRISEPRKPFLTKQGAKYVIESWKGHDKTSFTGLVPIGVLGYYYGDLMLKTANKQPKKSLIITHLNENTITIYLFPNYTLYPAKRLPFCRQFIAQRVKEIQQIETRGIKKGD